MSVKTFELPVTWELSGWVEVKAESKEEAVEKFNEVENSTGFKLPYGDYVDDSFDLSAKGEELLDIIKEED